jgi:hypothetical protein
MSTIDAESSAEVSSLPGLCFHDDKSGRSRLTACSPVALRPGMTLFALSHFRTPFLETQITFQGSFKLTVIVLAKVHPNDYVVLSSAYRILLSYSSAYPPSGSTKILRG